MNTDETGAAACLSAPILEPFLKELGVEEVKVRVVFEKTTELSLPPQVRHHYKVDVVVKDPTTGGRREIVNSWRQ